MAGSTDDSDTMTTRPGLSLVRRDCEPPGEQPPAGRRMLDPVPTRVPAPRAAPLSRAEVLMERERAAQDRAAAGRDRRAAERYFARASAYLRLADKDELTGALLRWPGMVALSRVVNQAHLEQSPLVVAFVDVDGLKRVNDSAGHAAGDDMLRAVGRALADALRVGDVVLRYGGDEFVCALPDADLPAAELRVLEVSRGLTAVLPTASISIGLVQLQPNEPAESVVRRADDAMYRARSQARGSTPDDQGQG